MASQILLRAIAFQKHSGTLSKLDLDIKDNAFLGGSFN
jgi:hypothetical protein